MQYITANFEQTKRMILVSAKAKTAMLMIGNPGIGKTALVAQVSIDLGLPVEVVIGSTCDSVDIAGIPIPADNGHSMRRIPMLQIRNACDKPCILFLDELSCSPPSVQAALLRLIHERVAGDFRLHPDTIVIAACNPVEQSPGGFELSAPLTNRFAPIVWFQPTLDEVCNYFNNLGEVDSTLHVESQAFAATLRVEPKLLQFDPPPTAITGGAQWASPRAWENGLKVYTQTIDMMQDQDLASEMLQGCVGQECAIAYQAIVKMRKDLPSVDQILADPENAMVPDARDKQLAAIGVLTQVASKDVWAAWVYSERLHSEIQMVVARFLMTRTDKGQSKHGNKGKQARVKATASVVK